MLVSIMILFGHKIRYILTEPPLYVLLIFFLLPGIILSALYTLIQNDIVKSHKFFMRTLFVCCLISVVSVFYISYSNWQEKRTTGNINSNRSFLSNNESGISKIAFDTLVSKFSNPNDIKINVSYVDMVPILNDLATDSIYVIRFLYENMVLKRNCKADFIVLHDTAFILDYNSEIVETEVSLDEFIKKTQQELNRNIQKLPDSVSLKKHF